MNTVKAALALAGAVLAVALPSKALAAQPACSPAFTVAPSFTVDDSFLQAASGDRAGDAMAAGHTYFVNTAYRPLIERWNGTGWVPMPAPAVDSVSILNGIAVSSASSALAVGYYAPNSNSPERTFAEVWNGTSWKASFPITFESAGKILNAQLNDVAATSPTDSWAVGFHETGTATVPLIEHWSGAGWSLAAAPSVGKDSQLEGVAADTTTDAWTVGFSLNSTTFDASPLVERWNGSGWAVVSTPAVGTSSSLAAVAIAGSHDVWAVGQTRTGSVTAPMALHWNGSKWSDVAVPSPTSNGASLASVAMIGPGDVWAFGDQVTDPASGAYAPLIEHWDGKSWSIEQGAPGIPAAGSSATISGSTVAAGRLLAVGYSQPDGTAAGSTSAEVLCPVQVQDGGFSPAAATVPIGSTVSWSVPVTDAASHSVLDDDGTGLFGSALIAPGGSFTAQLTAAGSYKVLDGATGHTSEVLVKMAASPSSGTTGTSFSLQWASSAPPAGYVFDVSIKRPGTSGFVSWRSSTTAAGASFQPDAGTGTYEFIARLRKSAGGQHTGFSPAVALKVT